MPTSPPRTRERILRSCRRLFNERGPQAVTTAEIAATVGINEGNLYYYFKKKEQIVLALFEEFNAALVSLGQRQMALSPVRSEGSADGIMLFFELVWEWRFFYRDAPRLYEMAPTLRERNKAVASATHQGLRRMLQSMIEHGRLRVPADELEPLVVNTWIVSTFWVEYLQSTQGTARITRKHLERGHQQVLALYRPYIVAA